uniref:Uncharacterized protein n=1 Tax=Romanomermis culicivorax TaxID=13658 RepID=A0A915JZQ6_ROMCU
FSLEKIDTRENDLHAIIRIGEGRGPEAQGPACSKAHQKYTMTSTQDIQCQQLQALSTSSHHIAQQTTIKEGFICQQSNGPFQPP